jgi:predicted dehydrogenase
MNFWPLSFLLALPRKPEAPVVDQLIVKKIRYAVVGLGNITQDAFLPAFKNAKNSDLVALVTGDKKKSDELSKRYRLDPSSTYSYDDYDKCLKSGKVDAVYIGLPNHLHCDYTVRAAKAGIHVLCEKPMAVNERECKRMIDACEKASVKLMIAYRLHFEEANLGAIETVKSGKIGDPRIFTSTFTQQVVDEDNVRLTEPESRGGGPLFDMGVYCINASRYIFREEPIEVLAASANNGEIRFREDPEMTAAILRFPKERLATIFCSFGAASASEYSVIGTRGWLRLAPAFDFHKPLASELIVDGATKRKQYSKHDQFGAELSYFSDCILKDRQPEPSGQEGLADIRIVRAIMKSAATRKIVKLPPFEKRKHPGKSQEIDKPAVKAPKLVGAAKPTR